MARCAMARRHDSVTKEMSTMSGGESYVLEKYNGAANREVVRCDSYDRSALGIANDSGKSYPEVNKAA